MFAVIETGGKQYKVAENDVIRVEKLPGKVGDTIKLDQVLMLDQGKGAEIGTPKLDGKSVTAEILDQGKGDKVVIFKKKRRKKYRRTKGHRQEQTILRIMSLTGAKKKAAPAKKKESKAKPEKKPAAKAKAPAKKPAAKKSTAKQAPKAKEKK